MMIMMKNEQRMLESMRRYAAADKSDPFCMARLLCHYRQGMLTPLQDGADGHYDATPISTADGMVVWQNRVRP